MCERDRVRVHALFEFGCGRISQGASVMFTQATVACVVVESSLEVHVGLGTLAAKCLVLVRACHHNTFDSQRHRGSNHRRPIVPARDSHFARVGIRVSIRGLEVCM